MRAVNLVLLMLLGGSLGLPVARASETGAVVAAEAASNLAARLWFPVGEELVYHAYWGVFHVAETRTTVNWTNHQGRDLLAVRIRTKSNKVISTIYPVDDFIETLIDPVTFLPVQFTKLMNEGHRHSDEVTVFDHAAGKAYWHNRKKNKRNEFVIEPDTRDLVALMYFLRREPFRAGQELSCKVMADEKMYDLYIKVAGRDRMQLDAYGEISSLRVEPTAAFEGIFVRKGKLTLWVSEDPRRIVTRIMAVIPVANVRVNLVEVRGPGEDEWIKRKDG